MAKKQKKSPPRKPVARAKAKVSRVVNQVKEPLSLLGTLKDEGLASAIGFLGMAGAMASEARKNLKLEAMRPQLKDLISSLGFAMRSDIEAIEARLEDLEQKLSEREYESLKEEE